MMDIVQRPHRDNLVRWASTRPEVLVLSADLTASCEADGFRDAYPERFFSLGMAEQNMIGFAAGLAREGFSPWVHSFAVFLTRRVFDQVAMAIAYPNLPVRLVGFLPGITTPGGVTHQAIDDIGLMRLLPNMTVLECGDATEVESVLEVAQGIEGPVYIRQLRGEVARLFDASAPMRLNQARLLGPESLGTAPPGTQPPGTQPPGTQRPGTQPLAAKRMDGQMLAGRPDLTVLSSGICTEEALRATQALRARGLAIAHLHVSTLKPFTDALVMEALASARLGVIACENHSIIGGLGSAVAEAMAELGSGRRLIRVGLRDTYAHGASRAYLMREYGLDAVGLVRAAETLAGEPLGIDESALAEVRPEVHARTMARGERTEDL